MKTQECCKKEETAKEIKSFKLDTSLESAYENPFFPLHFCSTEVEWHLLPFLFKYLKK